MTFEEACTIINSAVAESKSRKELLVNLFKDLGVKRMAEIGVWEGELSETILQKVDQIEHYVLVDPWRNLPDWNKPLNKSNVEFESVRNTALTRVAHFKEKVVEIRATTKEANTQIDDASLDLIYVDGDHTLRGITIDLILLLPKIRRGGFICGDDFSKTIWQHTTKYAPTEVFPFALYFAEAHDLPIFTLPYNQFIIFNEPRGFEVVDHGGYGRLTPEDIYAPPRGRLAELLVRNTPVSVKRFIKRFVRG